MYVNAESSTAYHSRMANDPAAVVAHDRTNNITIMIISNNMQFSKCFLYHAFQSAHYAFEHLSTIILSN